MEIKPDGQRVRVVSQPDGTQALLIDKAEPGDAGQYAVVATNEKGDTTCDAPLSVASKWLLSFLKYIKMGREYEVDSLK